MEGPYSQIVARVPGVRAETLWSKSFSAWVYDFFQVLKRPYFQPVAAFRAVTGESDPKPGLIGEPFLVREGVCLFRKR